jgi:hypothetical protein
MKRHIFTLSIVVHVIFIGQIILLIARIMAHFSKDIELGTTIRVYCRLILAILQLTSAVIFLYYSE